MLMEAASGDNKCARCRAGGRFSILIGSAGCQRALARQLGGSGGMPPQKNFYFETF